MQRDYDRDFKEYLEKEKTLAVMMLNRARSFSGKTALRFMEDGQWKSISWDLFGEQIQNTAKALLEMGVEPGDMVAVFSRNRPEWAVADLGILAVRGVSVPVYATNSADETAYIVDDAGVRLIFVGDQEQYDKALEVLDKCKSLEKIIAMDRSIKIQGGSSLYMDELIETGRASSMDKDLEKRLESVDSDDILTLIYTSGTTGAPKGAVHTHRSFMAGIFPSVSRFGEPEPGDVSLAILPLSHIFERMWSYGCMSTGFEIAYCPDPKQFVEIMGQIRPQYITSVPRIWEKAYAAINEGLKSSPPAKQKLFSWALEVGRKVFHFKQRGVHPHLFMSMQHKVADALVLSKVREKLGCDRNKVYHVGGAPFAPEINEFFQSVGINIIMGYGLTEFFPVCVGFGAYGRPGACGPVLPMVDVRISEEGEIQLKGQMAMKEYYNKPEATAETFTEDGWFRTGDMGILESGQYHYITITDRFKDIIITSGGKNISPQQIELLLSDEQLIEQAVVIGDGRKFISALIVPSFELLGQWAEKNNVTWSSEEDLVKNPAVVKMYEEIIEQRTQSLGRVEKIKKIRLLPRELTQDAGELTPTVKIKRKAVNVNFKDLIDEMYED